jgi:uncharacterized protein (TIGR02118 family)
LTRKDFIAAKKSFRVPVFEVDQYDEERKMAAAKLIVMYPVPTNIEAFEKIYQGEHVPMAVEKLRGKTKIVATKVLASPQGPTPFHRIVEVYFPSMQALEECAASEGGIQTLAHAVKISTGGAPNFLIAEEATFNFEQTTSA